MRRALLYFGFALTGVVTTMLGPLIPSLIAAWRVNDAQMGAVFTAQFVGALIGLAFTTALIRRLGIGTLLAAGFAAVALGVLGLLAGSWRAGMASVFVYGGGMSLVIPTINLYVAETNPRTRAASLNVLNFVWGAGALVSPFLIHRLGSYGMAVPIVLLAGLAGVLAISFWLVSIEAVAAPVETAAAAAGSAWRDPVLVFASLIAFLYVGAENAVAGWVVELVHRQQAPAFAGTLALSSFWAALLAARAGAPLALRKMSGQMLVLVALVVATVGSALVPATTDWLVMVGGAAVAGFGFATVLPTTFATFVEHFGRRADRIMGVMFASTTLGGASLPWCVGALSTSTGDLRVGLVVPVVACIGMIALQIGVMAWTRRGARPLD